MAADGFGFFGGQNISIGGFHTGVLMDGRVYDNNVPFGVSRTKWENGYMVTSLPEYQEMTIGHGQSLKWELATSLSNSEKARL